jgi:hypothetical protein
MTPFTKMAWTVVGAGAAFSWLGPVTILPMIGVGTVMGFNEWQRCKAAPAILDATLMVYPGLTYLACFRPK